MKVRYAEPDAIRLPQKPFQDRLPFRLFTTEDVSALGKMHEGGVRQAKRSASINQSGNLAEFAGGNELHRAFMPGRVQIHPLIAPHMHWFRCAWNAASCSDRYPHGLNMGGGGMRHALRSIRQAERSAGHYGTSGKSSCMRPSNSARTITPLKRMGRSFMLGLLATHVRRQP